MLKARVAVLVSGNGTNLQQLLNAEAEGHLPDAEIVVVIADNEQAYALQRAAATNTPTASVKKGCCKQQFEDKISALLQEYQVDIIVLAGFLTILSADFTGKWPERIINVHPSLIPSFCGTGFYGLRVHQAALDYGVKITGATVHFVNEITDGGKIMLQKAVEVLPDDTAETLQKRVMEEAEWVLLPRAVQMLAQQIVQER
jgi:phosphoribosylglycinamide formyltransferase-1